MDSTPKHNAYMLTAPAPPNPVLHHTAPDINKAFDIVSCHITVEKILNTEQQQMVIGELSLWLLSMCHLQWCHLKNL